MLTNTLDAQTRNQDKRDYDAPIIAVKRYIQDHLDEPLDREVLAHVANFSVPHLHRIFTGCVDENIAAFFYKPQCFIFPARDHRFGRVANGAIAEAANVV